MTRKDKSVKVFLWAKIGKAMKVNKCKTLDKNVSFGYCFLQLGIFVDTHLYLLFKMNLKIDAFERKKWTVWNERVYKGHTRNCALAPKYLRETTKTKNLPIP